jgi:hypothetical protein
MTIRRAAIAAATVIGVGIPSAVVVADALGGWPDGPLRTLYAPLVVLFALTGWVIATRRPENPIGPLFLSFGAVFAWYLPIDALAHRPDPDPLVRIGAVLSSASDAPMFIIMAWILLLFPDGGLLSRRWRWTLWLGALAIPAGVIGFTFKPGPIVAFAWLDNPLGIPGFPSDPLGGFGYLTLLVLLVAAALAMLLRFRRGGPVVRAQVKWVATAAALLLVTESGNLATFNAVDPYAQPFWLITSTISLALIPIAIGIAILRYRLYDIDVVIRRTLVYGVVVAILGGVYAALVLALQTVLADLTGGGTLPVAVSTLVIAALFGPLRARVRAAVDRRFYRSRYDAQRTLEAFSTRLRDEVAVDAVGRALADVASRAVRPASVAIWLRKPSP